MEKPITGRVEVREKAPIVVIKPKVDTSRKMRAVEWHGKKSVSVNHERPRPVVTDPRDVILKVTSTCICGSDLHLYVGAMPGMEAGDVMGHEFMGIVEEVGPEVRKHKKGDRVVACFDIACGECYFCEHQLFSCCDNTNDSQEEAALYGDRTGGFFGYSHMTGGWQGGQADFVRVPIADVNLLKVPGQLPDEKVIFLSDILPTAWHANEMGEVKEGDSVAIWGCGPVGILSAHCAKVRGAKVVFLIDEVQYRLDYAKKKLPFVRTVNFQKEKVYDAVRRECPHGVDVGIEAVGMHYMHTVKHKAEVATGLETDPSEMLNEIIFTVRKGGRISVIGAYAGFTNHFNIGAFMEKSESARGGQTPVQKYWDKLLGMVEKGELDPTMVITHQPDLDQAPEMYKIFNDKLDGCIKVVMHPHGRTSAHASA